MTEAIDASRVRDWAAGLRVIFGREIAAFFDSSIAYVYAIVFLLLSCGIFMNSFFLTSVVDMSEYFRILPILLVLFIPAITMRSWSEERSQGTIELLMTLPLRASQLILGKFLASVCFFAIVLVGSLPIVVMLLWLGQPDLGRILASYVGAVLLGALFLACGIFMSSLTRDQIVAFALSIFVCALFVLSGLDEVVAVIDGLTPSFQLGTWTRDSFSVMPHYQDLCRGIVRLSDVAYFALITGSFLVANRFSLQHYQH